MKPSDFALYLEALLLYYDIFYNILMIKPIIIVMSFEII